MKTLLDKMAHGGIVGECFLPTQPDNNHPLGWAITEDEYQPFKVIAMKTDSHSWYVPVEITVETNLGKRKKYSLDRHYADTLLTKTQWEKLKSSKKVLKNPLDYEGKLPLTSE